MKKVIALGFFDSLHIGHRDLLGKCKELAKACNGTPIVATFDDNFFTIIGRKCEEIFLFEERKDILRSLDLKDIDTFPSNEDFLSQDKYEFMEFLQRKNPYALVCGSDYRFGRNAEGNADDLKNFFLKKGVKILCVDLVNLDGYKISSSRIREMLKNGKVREASVLLGQNFFYRGQVIKGRADGRKIGFPTINIDIPTGKIHIKNGVYVTKTSVDGKTYPSVTNVGNHPTFDDDKFNVETYVIGEVCEVYGKTVRIEFIEFIREIKKFDNKFELADRIDKDILFAKEVLK